MQPKNEPTRAELFRNRLDQMIDPRHPLCKLAGQIAWGGFEKEFGALYVEGQGRPGKSIRLLVGLHYLKHMYSVSDERAVETFVENPYWQYFCGMEYFQHTLPLDATTLVKWRKRVGPDGMERMFKETLDAAQRTGQMRRGEIARVTVDTTVQPKAIAYPTDARLYQKMRLVLVREAERRGILLRQSYARVGKRALTMQGRYAHAQQFKRAAKQTRKLKTYLGRVQRDIERKAGEPDAALLSWLAMAERLLAQQRKDHGKLYSVWAPEVECIAKGKVHKKYEFGVKVSVVSSTRDNWIVGVDALPGNPYDGHTLEDTLEQVERLTGTMPDHAQVDKGYRGHGVKNATDVHLAGSRRAAKSRTALRWMKRRQAVEPIIGHLKSDHRLERNFLHGTNGDRVNAMLAAAAFNLRKMTRAFLRTLLYDIRSALQRIRYSIRIDLRVRCRRSALSLNSSPLTA